MIEVPMKTEKPLDRNSVMEINNRYIQKPNDSGSILILNKGRQGSTVTVQNTPVIREMKMPVLRNQVQKGQKVLLENNCKLSNVRVCLGWNVNNQNCDLDVSAFMLNNSGKVIGDDWFVFYGQVKSPDDSVRFTVSNNDDREEVFVDFIRMNNRVSKIVFVLTINEALERKLNFSMVRDAYIRIINCNDNSEIVSFKMDEYYANVTSMMIGEMYQYNGMWKFNAIGNGVAKDLAGLCNLYGVNIY